MAMDNTTRWSPSTATDRDFVLSELSIVLSSHHFKNSKRYPALLAYLVGKVLDGDRDQLKERTLGIEVFGRSPDYDTNADPIVRVTAAEVRRRIAQFYFENDNASRLQIELPLGSYVPEFKRSNAPQVLAAEENPLTASRGMDNFDGVSMHRDEFRTSRGAARSVDRIRFTPKSYVVGLVILLVSTLCLGVYALDRRSSQNTSNQFWRPILNSPGSVLAVLPTNIHRAQPPPDQNTVDPVSMTHGPYNHISVCDAVALSRFSSFLGKHSKPFDIKEADLTSLGDLHQRSAILVGALNNHWTMRLTEKMRFHFLIEPSSVRIVDVQNPQNRDWVVDYTKPYAYAAHDYAIIARYNDSTTGGNIVIIAGIGAHATQAASEFVATPNEMEQLGRIAPPGWENKNLEMIIKTDVINGDSGPPHLIAAASW